jgi:hypothetical protein
MLPKWRWNRKRVKRDPLPSFPTIARDSAFIIKFEFIKDFGKVMKRIENDMRRDATGLYDVLG